MQCHVQLLSNAEIERISKIIIRGWAYDEGLNDEL